MVILLGDAATVLKDFNDESIDCVVTSPPYWALRDYKTEGQLGLETTFQEYINKLLAVFDQIKRVLKKEGTCWVVLGDTYMPHNGTRGNITHAAADSLRKDYDNIQLAPMHKKRLDVTAKSLCMIPERFAIGMIDRGWILRNDIIWHKPNCMPSSATDRFTVDYEHIFFFVKSQRYYFKTQYEPFSPKESGWRKNDIGFGGSKAEGYGNATYSGNKFTQEGKEGRIKRAVWQITTQPYPDAHFAVFPEELIRTPIIAGCPEQICLKCNKAVTTEYDIDRVFTRPGNESKYYESEIKEQIVGGATKSFRGRPEITRTNPQIKKCDCNAGFKAGTVLDPFSGSGTTLLAAHKLLRNWIGIEINPDYVALAKKRLTPYIKQQRLEQYIQ